MSLTERRYNPLPYIESEVVDFRLNLPAYVDQERLGVNIKGLQKLCRLGGIKHLDVVGVVPETLESQQVSVTGVDQFGQATAALIKAKRESLFQTQSEENNTFPMFSWINASIHIDLEAVSTHVSQTHKDGVRSHKGWAKELDNAVTTGVRSLGTKHLFHPELLSTFVSLGWNGSALEDAISNTSEVLGHSLPPNTPQELGIFLIFLANNQLANLSMYIPSKVAKDIKDDYRFSLFSGIHIDRALLLQIMSRSITTMKELPIK